MIKHNYSKDGYHPKDVSFEVTAMLIDEEKNGGSQSTFTGLIAMEGAMSGTKDGYSKDLFKGFDPLTRKEEVEEYIKYEHERDLPYHHYVDKYEELQRDSKRFKTWKEGALLASLELKEGFFASIEDMILDDVLEKQKIFIESSKRESEEQVKRFEKSREEIGKKLYSKGVKILGIGDMPHVHALQHERANVRFRSL